MLLSDEKKFHRRIMEETLSRTQRLHFLKAENHVTFCSYFVADFGQNG